MTLSTDDPMIFHLSDNPLKASMDGMVGGPWHLNLFDGRMQRDEEAWLLLV